MSNNAWGDSWHIDTTYVCGTGLNGLAPKPGDPSPGSSLSARTVYGGITVSWRYPSINPHGVAYTRLFRGASSNFETAIELPVVAGAVYFDAMDVEFDTEFYYWIQIVSVNGTHADRIGPASAVARPLSAQNLESLTGLIDKGVLAQALKADIDGISIYGHSLTQEIANRLFANETLAEALAAVQSDLQEAMTYVEQEIIQRTEGDSALLSILNTYAAAVDQNVAAILEERNLRVDADEALASDVTALYATTGNLSTSVVNESTARASADEALAQQISSAQSQMGNDLATVQTNLQTKITTVDGKLLDIGALYTAKVQVNGLIGGFGVYNDGRFVEAGFDVDRFWVGRTGANKVKPFIIDNGTVYMDKARIRDADIDTLKIAGEAVTIPRVYFGSDLGGGVGTQGVICTGYIDCGGGGLIIIAATNMHIPDDGSGVMTLIVNGVTVHTQTLGGRVGGGDLKIHMPATVIHALSSPRYGVTVQVHVRVTGYTATFRQNRLVLMGGKR